MTDAADVAGTDAGEPADRAWQTPVLQTNVLVPIAIALGSLLAGAHLHLVYRRGRQLGLAELPRVQCLGRDQRPLWPRCAAGRLPDLLQSDRLFPGLLSAPSAAAALRPDDHRRGARPQSAADLFSDPRPAAGSGDGERDRRVDPDCRGRADDAFGSGHELLRHSHRASDSRRLHPDPVGGWIASRTLRSRRPADRRSRRAEADQCRLCARCRRRRARRQPAADGNALPRTWRRGRRAGDRRRMGADALARDGQSDFPALQRRVPVPGIGPDEHHGLAIHCRAASWTRWPIPSTGWSATTGARNIRSATRGLRSRRC